MRYIAIAFILITLAGCGTRYDDIDNWQAYGSDPGDKRETFEFCKARALKQDTDAANVLREKMRECMIPRGYKYRPK